MTTICNPRSLWLVAWTCVYLWTDVFPLPGVIPGREAATEIRLKVCHSDVAYRVGVEQRLIDLATDTVIVDWRRVDGTDLYLPAEKADPNWAGFDGREGRPGVFSE